MFNTFFNADEAGVLALTCLAVKGKNRDILNMFI